MNKDPVLLHHRRQSNCLRPGRGALACGRCGRALTHIPVRERGGRSALAGSEHAAALAGIVDTLLLARCDFLVGKFSSGLFRAANQLAVARRGARVPDRHRPRCEAEEGVDSRESAREAPVSDGPCEAGLALNAVQRSENGVQCSDCSDPRSDLNTV